MLERLRELAYADLDRAMLLGFEMSLEDIRTQGNPVHPDTVGALEWFREKINGKK